MAEITNWYLYKQENTPTDEERLNFSKTVAPDGKTIEVDVNLFMAGPGRFITAADIPLVGLFFRPDSSWEGRFSYTPEQLAKMVNLGKKGEYTDRHTAHGG